MNIFISAKLYNMPLYVENCMWPARFLKSIYATSVPVAGQASHLTLKISGHLNENHW